MRVVGITKLRNESHIIERTLDNWSGLCDRIHVYDDCSTDDTVEICRRHPSVVEVLASDLFDEKRERAEYYNRQILVNSALRFMEKDDWVVYFDGDEWIYDMPQEVLENERFEAIACKSFDAYITPEDAEDPYTERRWVGPEWQYQPYFFRAKTNPTFHKPDQRNPTCYLSARESHTIAGNVLHLGKAISIDAWEEKCNYYADVFGPKYAEKWAQRRGGAVHDDGKSDYGFDLVRWADVRSGDVEVFPRVKHPVVK